MLPRSAAGINVKMGFFQTIDPSTQVSIALNSLECIQNWVEISSFVNWKRVLLQQDNAKAFTATQNQENIQKLDASELLPQPPYSHDLNPSDYHFFRLMVHFLHGRRFNNLDEVERRCAEFFASKEWYQRDIELQTIMSNHIYFETLYLFVVKFMLEFFMEHIKKLLDHPNNFLIFFNRYMFFKIKYFLRIENIFFL